MSDPGWRSSPLRWWDVEEVAALEAQLFEGTAWSAETFWSELAAPGRAYWTARAAPGPGEDAGALLGYAGAAASGADADVQTIAVAPAARGLGLGDALLRACEEHAAAAGAGALLLEVAADNAAARRLYQRHGFERVALRRDYYGPGADALVLRRRPPLPRSEPVRGPASVTMGTGRASVTTGADPDPAPSREDDQPR